MVEKCAICEKEIVKKSEDPTKLNYLANATNSDRKPVCDNCYKKLEGLTIRQVLRQFITPMKQDKDAQNKPLYLDFETWKVTLSTRNANDYKNMPKMVLDTAKQAQLINKYRGK